MPFPITISDTGTYESSEKAESLSKYHNRADDGFVYFDCGSYTQGPVQMKSSDGENGDDDVLIMGRVSFATLPNSRVVFDASSKSWQTLVRTGTIQSTKRVDENANLHSDVDENEVNPEMMIHWGKYIVCRMPSTNQPWMLQRAKWEQSTLDENNVLEDKVKIEPNEVELQGWMTIWDSMTENDGGGDAKAHWDNKELDTFLLNGTSRVIQMGAACINTGEVKAVLRCYDDKGILKAVILQQGKLQGFKLD